MRIVAIGGGDFGTNNEKPYSLGSIDEEIVKLTNKAHPVFLFVGFNERANYIFGTLKKIYMALGAQCTYLKYSELENEKTIESKFKRADIIYFNGGNTIEYMKSIKKFGLEKYIKTAILKNTIMCGISAGAIIYHKFGSSDSRTYKDNDCKFTKVKGLGFIDGIFVPHFSNSKRPLDMERFMKNSKLVAICADNNSAIIFDDENYKVVKADDKAKIYKCYYKNKKFEIFEINQNGNVKDLLNTGI